MSSWIVFLVGAFVGGTVGAVTVGALAAERRAHVERELLKRKLAEAEADTDEFWPPDQGLRLVR